MSTRDNKSLVRRTFELMNAGNPGGLADCLGSGYRLHFNNMAELDAEHASGFFTGFLAAFPGLQHIVHDQVAEGDRVATRISVQGVNSESFMGMPATGRSVDFDAINIHRVVDGKIVEHWIISDALAMMQQLGVIPAMG